MLFSLSRAFRSAQVSQTRVALGQLVRLASLSAVRTSRSSPTICSTCAGIDRRRPGQALAPRGDQFNFRPHLPVYREAEGFGIERRRRCRAQAQAQAA